MKRVRLKLKYSALLLFVLTLHMLVHGLLLPKYDTGLFQKQSACTASLTAAESDDQAQYGDCKPPKNSFIDYSTFFLPKNLIPAYNPSVSAFLVHEPFRAHKQVYLEINVPPDNLAS